jgi:hypothetical protein
MPSNDELGDIVKRSVESMGLRPQLFEQSVQFLAAGQEIEFLAPLAWLGTNILLGDTNEYVFHTLGIAIRKWDSQEHPKWSLSTQQHSEERRLDIYKLLGFDSGIAALTHKLIPIFTEADQPIVIAEAHVDWYDNRALKGNFYWDAYVNFLRRKEWNDDAVAKLDESTTEVVSRLSDPAQQAIYQTKGLVVGYVQSGKTANFSGVLTKAADAGYRFFIVLAGTLDILRSQTQRRIDKEIIGKEQLFDEYAADPDWPEFVSHGEKPSEQGFFDWERLTSSSNDYEELGVAISALEFRSVSQALPYNDPSNLKNSPLRIIVIKKIPAIMQRLAKDLSKIRKKLGNVPTLIIDDESDQASINTIDPSKPLVDDKDRTATNREIVNLLKTLPRAQYLGYTATPFANVFIDPSEAEDLFPKDFIIALPRPKGYMGVADFYDFDSGALGFDSNERAYVRDIKGADGAGGDDQPELLLKAIDSFVLAGAIKLFRAQVNPKKYSFKHHTMLVHHSVSKASHVAKAKAVLGLFESAGYFSGNCSKRLAKLYNEDFAPVARSKGKDFPLPKSFLDLGKYIGECVAKLSESKTVRIVNGDNKDDTPDFDKSGVWAILVGGTKLSRGYTVEGLTTTYFRRVSSTTDTLMQMGRWFGYRPGYTDLVRLFIGRAEKFGTKGKKNLDLYEAFSAMCKDEEKFRREIRKYKGTLTPRQIPPLVPSHLKALRPVARNKMYNTYITFRNFGGTWSEPTMAPAIKKIVSENQNSAQKLLESCTSLSERQFLGSKKGKDSSRDQLNVKALCGITTTENMIAFLEEYKWLKDDNLLVDELMFLDGKEGDPAVDDWLIIAPMVKETRGVWPAVKSTFPQISVQLRSRVGVRYGAYTTSAHRAVAEYMATVNDDFLPVDNVNADLKNGRRGVLLFYPIQAEGEVFINIGFALLFPPNKLQGVLSYSVRNSNKPDDVVVLMA